ncbi:MAG: rhodanese-like domain-containing protein [Sulfurospirillum sp.]|nr:rhodanese-like domain-containing protein [Sulfurospirillum sp.]
MRKIVGIFFILMGFLQAQTLKEVSFDAYLESFDYQERSAMKIRTPDMLALVEEGKAILVDIRFREEYAAWHIAGSLNIPLNELPRRIKELPKDKLIITACPHNDRSNMARIYLTLKGYKAVYLNDGLLKTADFLRGENAKEYMDELKMLKEKK